MILIIDNYDSFTYNLYQALAAFHYEIVVKRNDVLSVSDILALNPQGIILSPGPGRPEQAGICVELIRAIISGNFPAVPVLGVCLGHQALIVAAGGQVIPANEIVHGKEDEIFHVQTGLYRELAQPFTAGRYHSLIADPETLPESLIIDALNQGQLIMGVHHRELPLYGLQFHPESILTPEGVLLLRAFVESCGINT